MALFLQIIQCEDKGRKSYYPPIWNRLLIVFKLEGKGILYLQLSYFLFNANKRKRGMFKYFIDTSLNCNFFTTKKINKKALL